jgi:hypothetical protein
VTVFGSLLLTLMLPAAAPVAAAGTERPSLAGSWTLNAELSEKLADKMRDSFRNRGGPGGGGFGAGGGRRGGFGGGGRGGGRRGGGPGDGSSPDAARGPQRFDSGAEKITIDQSATAVTIRDANDQVRTLTTDGKKVKITTPRGDEVEMKATWKDARLTIEQDLPRGGHLKETYERASDGQRLQVTVSLEPAGRPAVTAKRVYDPAEPTPSS